MITRVILQISSVPDHSGTATAGSHRRVRSVPWEFLSALGYEFLPKSNAHQFCGNPFCRFAVPKGRTSASFVGPVENLTQMIVEDLRI